MSHLSCFSTIQARLNNSFAQESRLKTTTTKKNQPKAIVTTKHELLSDWVYSLSFSHNESLRSSLNTTLNSCLPTLHITSCIQHRVSTRTHPAELKNLPCASVGSAWLSVAHCKRGTVLLHLLHPLLQALRGQKPPLLECKRSNYRNCAVPHSNRDPQVHVQQLLNTTFNLKRACEPLG